jgi:hypothetical protein
MTALTAERHASTIDRQSGANPAMVISTTTSALRMIG